MPTACGLNVGLSRSSWVPGRSSTPLVLFFAPAIPARRADASSSVDIPRSRTIFRFAHRRVTQPGRATSCTPPIPPPTRTSHITCHPRLNQVRRHVQLPCRSLLTSRNNLTMNLAAGAKRQLSAPNERRRVWRQPNGRLLCVDMTLSEWVATSNSRGRRGVAV